MRLVSKPGLASHADFPPKTLQRAVFWAFRSSYKPCMTRKPVPGRGQDPERGRQQRPLSQALPLEGASNFRDLGGHRGAGGARVVPGKVFRADGLHRLVPADRSVLDPLGIEVVFDLRSERELENDGTGEFVAGRRHVHVPLVRISLSPFSPEIDWANLQLQERYVEMLHEGGESMRTIFGWLASSASGACVFHCTGGKDRTGVVAAVLLRVLGVSRDDVIADYAVSEKNLRSVLESYRDEMIRQGMDDAAIAYLTSSPPERMERTLAELDRIWGSPESYLQSVGVNADVINRLRASLLED